MQAGLIVMASKSKGTRATSATAVASPGATGKSNGRRSELHQQAGGNHPPLTTSQGIPVADNQNSLRTHPRGPTLLEDFILREKITHFDHERIPEHIAPNDAVVDAGDAATFAKRAATRHWAREPALRTLP